MHRTVLHTVDKDFPDLATPYVRGGWIHKKLRPIDRLSNVSSRYASSGLVSTPSDLVRLFLALDRGVLLSDSTRALMGSVPFPEVNDGQAYGWSRAVTDHGDVFMYGSGNGMGYTGLVVHYPKERVTGALLVNKADFDRRLEVLDHVLEPFLEAARRKQD